MSKLRSVSKWLNDRTVRDRLIVLSVGMIFIYFIWLATVQGSLRSTRAKNSRQIEQLQKQSQVYRDELMRQTKELAKLSDSTLKAQQKSLQETLASLDSKLNTVVVDLMSKKHMMQTLRALLGQSNALKLLELKSSKPEVLAKPHDVSSNDASATHLYKESVTIQFQGDYFSTLAYLKNLEKDEAKVMWNELVYQVDGYPIATVSIGLSFVSERGGPGES